MIRIIPAPRCAFKKVIDKSRGISSGCASVGAGSVSPVNTVESCQAGTKAYGGNVFNWKDGTCYYKKCTDRNLLYTEKQLGWDVYFLECEEGEHTDIFYYIMVYPNCTTHGQNIPHIYVSFLL